MTTTHATRSRSTLRAVLAGALLLSLGATGTARAADAGKAERTPRTLASMMTTKAVEVMQTTDEEKKGYVTHDELLKFQEELLQRIDEDEDGRLGEPEFTDRG